MRRQAQRQMEDLQAFQVALHFMGTDWATLLVLKEDSAVLPQESRAQAAAGARQWQDALQEPHTWCVSRQLCPLLGLLCCPDQASFGVTGACRRRPEEVELRDRELHVSGREAEAWRVHEKRLCHALLRLTCGPGCLAQSLCHQLHPRLSLRPACARPKLSVPTCAGGRPSRRAPPRTRSALRTSLGRR